MQPHYHYDFTGQRVFKSLESMAARSSGSAAAIFVTLTLLSAFGKPACNRGSRLFIRYSDQELEMQTASPNVVSTFSIRIEQIQDYEFKVVFDKPQFAQWQFDEPAPLGRDSGPNPARVLAAAVGNCLSASLLFCARRAKVELGAIRTTVSADIVRNSRGRLRIGRIDVNIDPGLQAGEREKASRCLTLFEDYCVVTQSVRDGIDVQVRVAGFERNE